MLRETFVRGQSAAVMAAGLRLGSKSGGFPLVGAWELEAGHRLPAESAKHKH